MIERTGSGVHLGMEGMGSIAWESEFALEGLPQKSHFTFTTFIPLYSVVKIKK